MRPRIPLDRLRGLGQSAKAGLSTASAASSGSGASANSDAPLSEPPASTSRIDPAVIAAAGLPSAQLLAEATVASSVSAAGVLPAIAPAETRPDDRASEAVLSTADDALARLAAFGEVVLSWVAEDGYPMNVATAVEVVPLESLVRFDVPAGFQIPLDAEIAITGAHIRPLASGGFDERSHVTVWGHASARPRGRLMLRAERAWIWDESEMPLPAAYERSLPKARRYFEELSRRRGYRIRPRMSLSMLLFRATRAPFLSATLVPVMLGLAIAGQAGAFDLQAAVLTLVAACLVHFGLNVANDVFDTLAGADDANPNPTKFSGGSRVIQNALVSVRHMSMLAAACYGLAALIGLILFQTRGSSALAAIVAAGVAVSLLYTMPPVKLVYRGLGEIATFIGFGPLMLVGAYVVQSRGTVSTASLVASVPVGLLVAMILYVNEIPDRYGDAQVGKRTIPVRFGKRVVIFGFDVSVTVALATIAVGTALGVLPLTALLALMTIPLARAIHQGLEASYDRPYALMPTMALNIQLHMAVGMLLILGYVAAIADQQLLGLRPFIP